MQYSYNADGTVQSKTDAMGQLTQYTYDTYARVNQVSYLPNGQPEDICQRVTYEYDTYHGQGSNPIGRLTGMTWSENSRRCASWWIASRRRLCSRARTMRAMRS